MPSTVPTAKANLVSQLAARPGLSGIQVVNGSPFPSPQRKLIWIGAADGEQEWGAMGGLRHEVYGLVVNIIVVREGTDIVAADTDCFAILAELEAQLRTDPTINGAVTTAKVGEFHLVEQVTAEGEARISSLAVTVDCQHYF